MSTTRAVIVRPVFIVVFDEKNHVVANDHGFAANPDAVQ